MYSPGPSSHLPSGSAGGGSTEHLEDALSVMASHVKVLGNDGDVIDVPPGEDISERLPSVTGGNDSDETRECKLWDEPWDVSRVGVT
jgi:hypothetical protein